MINKSYYAVIPANVRYSKEIPDGAKLLYGEITALCNENGYCWATNKYFADLYQASERTIKRWISGLARAGFILTTVEKENANSRKIWLMESRAITDKNVTRVVTKMSRGYGQKCHEGSDKNVPSYKENNTLNNTVEVKATTTAKSPSSFKAENNRVEGLTPPPAAAPAFGRVDIAAEVERLRTDQTARENFTITRKIPADRFERYVADFSREVSGTAETYWKVADFRRHFFNWCEIHYRKENERKAAPTVRPALPPDMINLNAL